MKTLSICLLPWMLLVSCGKKSSEEDAPAAVHERKDGMVKLPGGSYQMGSDGYFTTPYGPKEFPEEAPLRQVSVKGFWIDETEVTNDQFAAFVNETGYVTFAEREAKPEDFPLEARASLPQGKFHQGAIFFSAPKTFEGDPNDEGAYLQWWRWDPSANWRQPGGEGSSIEGKGDHPVVCIDHEDALAYAKWAGKRLPTEAEWEYAARGGLHAKMYTWGDELQPGGKWMANTFQGEFPAGDSGADGFKGSAPVRSYAPNGFGLYDMAGNAWELCQDFYDPEYPGCCETSNPQGPKRSVNRHTGQADGPAHHVTKGGSFLCHISYCMRYRPAARHSQEEGSPSAHTGIRCVRDIDP